MTGCVQRAIRRSSEFGFRSIVLAAVLFVPNISCALGQAPYITEVAGPGSFPLVDSGTAAPLYVGGGDFSGVRRAVIDLQGDIAQVTGCSPKCFSAESGIGKNVVIIGTLGKSPLLDRLIRLRKIDVSKIAGQWESFLIQVVFNPLPDVNQALVICGSDKRGTIYGVYDLSEEIGVSPWHFWEDVPPAHRKALFAKAGNYVQGPPAVKYRGIFLNDEAPDLSGWVQEKFGGYNHAFYTNVFELLLRLRANYLWPAMWDNCFNEDDPLNSQLADDYGIVMGTSHVEPMMRADKEWNRAGFTSGEWNFETHAEDLQAFWRQGIERNKNYENIITMAMRGKIDTPMSETANIALLENIVACQRKIISVVYHTNAAALPQLWALYKEVQQYYELGMRVPDDVTLLWCDDNWGNLRRLPSVTDRRRAGGSGIYYHFDYVGGPRNYKWVDSSPLPKVREQMNLAWQYGADRIWIVNVGHLQHVALPTEFFLTMAWDPARWPAEKLGEFTRLWAGREFGGEQASQIAHVVSVFSEYNGRRKPELLDPDTFSLVNYREADTVLADWRALADQAEQIAHDLPAERRDAFFELVLYPVKACANLNALYIAAAKNKLYATQGRASANDYAEKAKQCFQTDALLTAYYNHKLAGGRWNHMMDQTHIGYSSWQQPSNNVMPILAGVLPAVAAEMGVAIEGATNAWPAAATEAVLPTFDKFNEPSRYFEVFNKGTTSFKFSAAPTAPWIILSQTNGRVGPDQRVWVTVNWQIAPQGVANGFICLSANGNPPVKVRVNLFNPISPARDSIRGFVEADGYVSMEAEHFMRQRAGANVRWQKIDNLGGSLSAMSVFPVMAASVSPPKNSPCLEFPVFLFHGGGVKAEFTLSPTLNFVARRGLRFAASFDDDTPQTVTAVPAGFSVGAGDGNRDWEQAAKDGVRRVTTAFSVKNPGEHVLKFWMVDPGVALEKIVVSRDGVPPSYLGPPESFHR